MSALARIGHELADLAPILVIVGSMVVWVAYALGKARGEAQNKAQPK